MLRPFLAALWLLGPRMRPCLPNRAHRIPAYRAPSLHVPKSTNESLRSQALQITPTCKPLNKTSSAVSRDWKNSVSAPVSQAVGAILYKPLLQLLSLVMLLISGNAYAATGDLNLDFTEIIELFVSYMLEMRPIISEQTSNLIFYLGVFTITLKGISLIYKQGTILLFASEMVKLILVFGMTYFMLHNFYELAKDIIDSFLLMIDQNTDLPNLSSLSINEFFKLVSACAQNFMHKNTFIAAFFLFAMYICIGVLMILYALSYLGLLFNLIMGSICIACLSMPAIRFIAFNFILSICSGIVHFCSLCFMLRITEFITAQIFAKLNAALLVGDNIHLQSIATIIITMCLLCFLSFSIPNKLSSIFSTALGSVANSKRA